MNHHHHYHHTDRNHWDTLAQENDRRTRLGLTPRPPHPADDRIRAERWLTALGAIIGAATVGLLLALIHGF
jgi:hypothetical protein